MTNIKELRRICESMTGNRGCAKCPGRKMCDSLNDLKIELENTYRHAGSAPADWTMYMAKRINDALITFLYEMDATVAEVTAAMEDIRKEEDE